MDPSTHDITVEDPSEGFVKLRDFVDCQRALCLPAFQPPSIHGPFQGAISTAARDTLHLHKVGREKDRERIVGVSLSADSGQESV